MACQGVVGHVGPRRGDTSIESGSSGPLFLFAVGIVHGEYVFGVPLKGDRISVIVS